jgi:hypothetical protein
MTVGTSSRQAHSKASLQEEDLLARSREELVKAERRVSAGKRRVENLLKVGADLIDPGHDTSKTVALLVTLQDTQRLLEVYYQKLCAELGERR